MQLEERRAAQAAASQTERAAKAVLVAATAAARQGRVLSDAERADAERSVRQPEEYAADQESKRAAQAQARSTQQTAFSILVPCIHVKYQEAEPRACAQAPF